jgi:hypothetical protein
MNNFTTPITPQVIECLMLFTTLLFVSGFYVKVKLIEDTNSLEIY